MAFQIILVMETKESSKSDYMYISSVLDQWYDFRARNDIKLSEVYMGGKGNYKCSKVVKRIEKLTNSYNNGETHVIYFFDTDRYENNINDSRVLREEQEYCTTNNYEFVWFCHDIEEVFLGRTVAKNEKTDEAIAYARRRGINRLKKESFKAEKMGKKRSNLILVLDKYFGVR